MKTFGYHQQQKKLNDAALDLSYSWEINLIIN